MTLIQMHHEKLNSHLHSKRYRMQQLLILFFAILSINSIHAQRVSNNEFTWINNADCAYSGETFVAVMVKPQPFKSTIPIIPSEAIGYMI